MKIQNQFATVFMVSFASLFSASVMAQSVKTAPSQPRPTDEIKQPENDKTLLQERVDSSSEDGASDTESEAHFKVQPPLPSEQKPRFERTVKDDSRFTEQHQMRDFSVVPGYFQIGFGYVHSRWSEFAPALQDGSLNFRVGAFRSWDNFDAGLAINMISGDNNNGNNENMYAYSVGIEGLYRLGDGMVQGLGGMGFHVGSYRVWSLASETPNSISFNKLGDGFLVGLTPQLGVRFKMSPSFSVDILTQYLGYLNKPNFRVGGWNAGINLNFSRWSR